MNINWLRFEERIIKIVKELVEPALNQNRENKYQIENSLDPKLQKISKKFELINDEFFILQRQGGKIERFYEDLAAVENKFEKMRQDLQDQIYQSVSQYKVAIHKQNQYNEQVIQTQIKYQELLESHENLTRDSTIAISDAKICLQKVNQLYENLKGFQNEDIQLLKKFEFRTQLELKNLDEQLIDRFKDLGNVKKAQYDTLKDIRQLQLDVKKIEIDVKQKLQENDVRQSTQFGKVHDMYQQHTENLNLQLVVQVQEQIQSTMKKNDEEMIQKMKKKISKVELLIGTKMAGIDKVYKQAQIDQNKNIENIKQQRKQRDEQIDNQLSKIDRNQENFQINQEINVQALESLNKQHQSLIDTLKSHKEDNISQQSQITDQIDEIQNKLQNTESKIEQILEKTENKIQQLQQDTDIQIQQLQKSIINTPREPQLQSRNSIQQDKVIIESNQIRQDKVSIESNQKTEVQNKVSIESNQNIQSSNQQQQINNENQLSKKDFKNFERQINNLENQFHQNTKSQQNMLEQIKVLFLNQDNILMKIDQIQNQEPQFVNNYIIQNNQQIADNQMQNIQQSKLFSPKSKIEEKYQKIQNQQNDEIQQEKKVKNLIIQEISSKTQDDQMKINNTAAQIIKKEKQTEQKDLNDIQKLNLSNVIQKIETPQKSLVEEQQENIEDQILKKKNLRNEVNKILQTIKIHLLHLIQIQNNNQLQKQINYNLVKQKQINQKFNQKFDENQNLLQDTYKDFQSQIKKQELIISQVKEIDKMVMQSKIDIQLEVQSFKDKQNVIGDDISMRVMDVSQRAENKFTEIDSLLERQNMINRQQREDFEQLKDVGIKIQIQSVQAEIQEIFQQVQIKLKKTEDQANQITDQKAKNLKEELDKKFLELMGQVDTNANNSKQNLDNLNQMIQSVFKKSLIKNKSDQNLELKELKQQLQGLQTHIQNYKKFQNIGVKMQLDIFRSKSQKYYFESNFEINKRIQKLQLTLDQVNQIKSQMQVNSQFYQNQNMTHSPIFKKLQYFLSEAIHLESLIISQIEKNHFESKNKIEKLTESRFLQQIYSDEIDKIGFGEDVGLTNIFDTIMLQIQKENQIFDDYIQQINNFFEESGIEQETLFQRFQNIFIQFQSIQIAKQQIDQFFQSYQSDPLNNAKKKSQLNGFEKSVVNTIQQDQKIANTERVKKDLFNQDIIKLNFMQKPQQMNKVQNQMDIQVEKKDTGSGIQQIYQNQKLVSAFEDPISISYSIRNKKKMKNKQSQNMPTNDEYSHSMDRENNISIFSIIEDGLQKNKTSNAQSKNKKKTIFTSQIIQNNNVIKEQNYEKEEESRINTGRLQRNQSDLKTNTLAYTYNPYSTISQQDLISMAKNDQRKNSVDIKQKADIILPIIESTKRYLMQKNDNDRHSNFVINDNEYVARSKQIKKSLNSINKQLKFDKINNSSILLQRKEEGQFPNTFDKQTKEYMPLNISIYEREQTQNSINLNKKTIQNLQSLSTRKISPHVEFQNQ